MPPSSEHTPDLDALLRRVADGDADAFASFYDETCARVFGLILRVLRDRGYSEEATQEVYAQVWRSAAGFDAAEGSALAWVMTLAHRRAVDRVRAEVASNRRESTYGAMHIDPAVDVVADAAVLCPSFHKIEVITHPSAWDRLTDRLNRFFIGLLQPA